MIGIALAAALVTACGEGDRPTVAAPGASTSAPDPTTAHATTPPPTTPSDAGRPDEVPAEQQQPAAFRAVSVVDELVVFDLPGGSEIARLPARTEFGTPTVLGVLDVPGHGDEGIGPAWVEVLVPIRPNDLTGWVHTGDVDLEPVDVEVFIDVEQRTLRLLEAGEQVGQWPVAVGMPDRPTPTGRFFITDKLETGDPGGVYGPWAFGLSAFSDVLTDFIGGIGQVGLHGTNNPDSIGQAASSGCIRLPNEVMADLIERLPLGTPVHIA